ncbi:snare-like protein [Violaceomyces palustris]|uniref:Snare-like protein n=1 Tax=Violaceomyces palustris TaxID=1673888 RepID=A0ACD0P6T2_9BASI|nr:snare-like protein [Violaceomyces palustris]
MSNLTLYTTTAVLVLDSDGNRIIAKYYQPPHASNFLSSSTPAQQAALLNSTPQLISKNPFSTFKEQRAFEKSIFEKTRRATGDIILYDSHLVLFKSSLDVIFYVVAPSAENELMLSGLLSAFYDATSMLVRHQVEKRAILENLDLVTLALDETVDDGIILETDSTTIASRVSRPRPDVTEIQINEQTIMSAYSSLKERVAQRILQGGL